MQIKIVRKPTNDLLKASKLKMKLANKKTYRICVMYGVLGVILLLIGLSNFDILGDIFRSTGLVFLLLAGRFLYQSSVINSKVLEILQKRIIYNKDNGREIVVTMDDLIFTFRDAQSYLELKWSLFTSYKIYQDYLFLLIGDDILSSHSINKNEMSPQDFTELYRFVSGIMPERK